ncbi:hypothetical protein pb186bvf_015531 [Paramecium bursaria]
MEKNLTVREHIELFSDIKGIPQHKKKNQQIRNSKKWIQKDLKIFNLDSFQEEIKKTVTMIGNPPIVFLDEPSTGMDTEARRFMWNVISRIVNERKQSTIILTTHSMEEAEALSTKIAIQVEKVNLRFIGSDLFNISYKIHMQPDQIWNKQLESQRNLINHIQNYKLI